MVMTCSNLKPHDLKRMEAPCIALIPGGDGMSFLFFTGLPVPHRHSPVRVRGANGSYFLRLWAG